MHFCHNICRQLLCILFIEFCLLTPKKCHESSDALVQDFDEYIDQNDFQSILNTFNHRFATISNCYAENNNTLLDTSYCRVSY